MMELAVFVCIKMQLQTVLFYSYFCGLIFITLFSKSKINLYIDPGSTPTLLPTSVKNSEVVLVTDSTLRASTRVLKA